MVEAENERNEDQRMPDDETETDYTVYADKAPTDLQERFAAWIPEVTGYDPASAKTKQAAFDAGVRLGTALRMEFQRSPENQEHLAELRADVAKRKAEQAENPKVKGRPGRKPKTEAETEAEETEETPAPKPAKRAAKKAAPAPVTQESVEDDEEQPARPPRRPAKRTASAKSTKTAPF